MMSLFGRETDLVKRILNLILIIWFIIALFVLYSNIINILIKEPAESFESFKSNGCYSYRYYEGIDIAKPDSIEDITDEFDEEICQANYDVYMHDYNNNFQNIKSLLYAFGNTLIVGITLFIINKKQS